MFSKLSLIALVLATAISSAQAGIFDILNDERTLTQIILHKAKSPHSQQWGQYYFTDHAKSTEYVPEAIQNIPLEQLDDVVVEDFFWFCEKRFMYEHTYLVLKTKLSAAEKALMPDVEYKYYVTEKESMGIIWATFYDWDRAAIAKTQHHGIYIDRHDTYLYAQEHFEGDNVYKVNDLKKFVNNDYDVVYILLETNCHCYGMTLQNYLEMGQKLAQNAISA